MDILNLIITLVSGVVGGNVAGAAMPDKSLGAIGNSITGLLGGGVGELVLRLLGIAATTAATGDATGSAAHLDFASILSSIIAGGAGGGALTAIVGIIKDALAKK